MVNCEIQITGYFNESFEKKNLLKSMITKNSKRFKYKTEIFPDTILKYRNQI